MNKKIALVTLIETSMVATTEEKLVFIDMVPELTDAQVDALGKYLARERDVVLSEEGDIMETLQRSMNTAGQQVFVGSGKAE